MKIVRTSDEINCPRCGSAKVGFADEERNISYFGYGRETHCYDCGFKSEYFYSEDDVFIQQEWVEDYEDNGKAT